MNNKRIAFVFFIGITISGILFGYITKCSYKDDLDMTPFVEKYDELCDESSVQDDPNNCFLDEQITDVESLVSLSDVCVKVKVEDKKRIYNAGMTLTSVRVLGCYKGECEDVIEIAEPVYVLRYLSPVRVYSILGYRWMEEGMEYILFLRKLKNVALSKNEYIYLPSTAMLSKYCVDSSYLDNTSQKYHKLKEEVIRWVD